MPPYTVFDVPDLSLRITNRSGGIIAEASQATITDVQWELNKEGKLDFSLPKTDPVAAMIRTGQHEAQLWWKGVPEWTGPIWHRRSKPTVVEFNAQGLLSYFLKRFVLNASLLYTSVEQTAIFNALVSAAQTGFANMSYNISAGTSVGGSAHTRSRNYVREKHQCFYDIMREFTGIRDGFDIEVVVDASGTQRSATAFYPSKLVNQNTIGLEWGRNILDYTLDDDAFGLANRVYATGGSANGVKFENNYEDSVSEGIYGQMQKVVSDSSQIDVAWLLDFARRNVEAAKNPSEVVTVNAVEVPQALIGVVHTGDMVPVVIDDNDVQYTDMKRVRLIKWRPDTGQLSYEFTMPVVLA